MRQISAAHPTLPMPSLVEVTNLENGRSLRLRVNDRGPFHGNREIDLSQAAARELGFENQGLAKVRVRFLGLLPANGTPPRPGSSTRPSTVAASTIPVTQEEREPQGDRLSATSLADSCGTTEAHFVQVAAVREAASVRRLAAELDTLGDVELAEAAEQLTRVRLGPYPNRRDAFGKLAQVRGLGYHDALVVSCS
jgi:rare lipoprotein A